MRPGLHVEADVEADVEAAEAEVLPAADAGDAPAGDAPFAEEEAELELLFGNENHEEGPPFDNDAHEVTDDQIFDEMEISEAFDPSMIFD